jgi:hypothetical protein
MRVGAQERDFAFDKQSRGAAAIVYQGKKRATF